MDRSVIPLILKEINLDDKHVANIYQHGSWVYGTNTAESDIDLIVVTHSTKKGIQFNSELNYFHEFVLHRLWNQYDICVYSLVDFQILLEINYLCVLQCLFLPEQFKLKEEIDFRSIYFEKYYNPLLIKRAAAYEMSTDLNLYYSRFQSSFNNHPKCSSNVITTNERRLIYIFKNLFHGIRYLNFSKQLIEKKTIDDYSCETSFYNQIREDSSSESGLARVVECVHKKSLEYKSIFERLIPENFVQGSFEVYITFAYQENLLNRLIQTCENSRYKLEFSITKQKNLPQQFVISTNYNGQSPEIIQQIEKDTQEYFKEFNIIRLKIEASDNNYGLPLHDFECQLLWNNTKNYFTFQLTFSLEKNSRKTVEILRKIYCSMFRHLQLPLETWKKHTFIKDDQFLVTIDFFTIGRINAFKKRDQIKTYFLENGFQPLTIQSKFIIYDTNIQLE